MYFDREGPEDDPLVKGGQGRTDEEAGDCLRFFVNGLWIVALIGCAVYWTGHLIEAVGDL